MNQNRVHGEPLRTSMNFAERINDKDNQIPLHLAEDSTSPRNLKKLTATFKDKLNLNNNVSSTSTSNISSAQTSSPSGISQRAKKN